MTQIPFKDDAHKQSVGQHHNLPDSDYVAQGSQQQIPDQTAQDARAVLHLPVRMRGVYRYAPSLKGA